MEIHVIFLTVICILIVIHYTYTSLYILELFRSLYKFSAIYQLVLVLFVRHISFLRQRSSVSVLDFLFVLLVICGILALFFLPVVHTLTFSFVISAYCGISALLGLFRSYYKFSAASQLCLGFFIRYFSFLRHLSSAFSYCNVNTTYHREEDTLCILSPLHSSTKRK